MSLVQQGLRSLHFGVDQLVEGNRLEVVAEEVTQRLEVLLVLLLLRLLLPLLLPRVISIFLEVHLCVGQFLRVVELVLFVAARLKVVPV